MKKANHYFVFLFLLFNTFWLYGQNTINIDYDVKNNNTIDKYRLSIIDEKKSEWTYISTSEANEIDYTDSFFYKDKEARNIFYQDNILSKMINVKDLLNDMKWELTTDKKKILNLDCYTAKTQFRGRSYIAYYTREIPVDDGPWKFGGLPGLILEVSSEDGLYTYTATSLNNKSIEVKAKKKEHKEKDFTTWEDFKKKYVVTIDNYVRLIKTHSDGTGIVKIEMPEIIYPKVQIEGINY